MLLLLPGFAIAHQELLAWSIATGYMVLVSGVSYWSMASDKKRAILQEWRIPESQLHLLELAGGWPGSFLSQCRFRHKKRKFRYQFSFWLIVAVYQYLAADFLMNWQLSQSIFETFQEILKR